MTRNVLFVSGEILEKCFRPIGRSILYLFGLLYETMVFIQDRIESLRSFSERTLHRDESSENIGVTTLSLQKIPGHLTVVLGPEEPSYVDLAKIVLWCLPAGVLHVSFYHHEKDLDCLKLYEKVNSLGKHYIPKIKWGKSFDDEIKLLSKNSINGYLWQPQLRVNIYKQSDGLESLADIVKSLDRFGVDRVDVNTLNVLTRNNLGAPDPDLTVVCGPILSYYGFVPWHLRTTQFCQLKTHHNMSVKKFLRILNEYSQCEQRYGK